MPVDNPLPSDARFRSDLRTLKEGKLEEAQVKKIELEEIQRRVPSYYFFHIFFRQYFEPMLLTRCVQDRRLRTAAKAAREASPS